MISEDLSIIGVSTTCILPHRMGRDAPALLLYSDTEIQLASGDIQGVRTGIQICLPTGYWAEIRPIRTMTARLLDAKIEILETVSGLYTTSSENDLKKL